MTLNEIVYDILNIASSGIASDDFRINKRQIEYWIHEVRSMLISQAIQKKQDTSDVWMQTIKATELTLVDVAECADLIADCKILKTINKIPNTIEVDGINSILSVTGVDGEPISKLNYFKSKYKKYSKYTSDSRGWFLRNNYIYVIQDKELKYININGIFEDPSALESFKCDNDPSWTADSDYPVSLKMASTITDIIIQTKIMALLRLPTDKTNDSSDEAPAIASQKQSR